MSLGSNLTFYSVIAKKMLVHFNDNDFNAINKNGLASGKKRIEN